MPKCTQGVVTVCMPDKPLAGYADESWHPDYREPPCVAELDLPDWGAFAEVVVRMEAEDDFNKQGVANAHRLADCWNVLVGIEDPAQFMADLKGLLACDDGFERMGWYRKVEVHMKGADDGKS